MIKDTYNPLGAIIFLINLHILNTHKEFWILDFIKVYHFLNPVSIRTKLMQPNKYKIQTPIKKKKQEIKAATRLFFLLCNKVLPKRRAPQKCSILH